MWYKFSKKKYDSAIVALCFKPKDISTLKIKHNLSKDEIVPKDEYHVTMMYLGKVNYPRAEDPWVVHLKKI